jgi:hypothetical protein
METITTGDRQKVKLAALFSTLGVVGFLLNLVAGFGLWGYGASRDVVVPTYDRFVVELQSTDASKMPRLATAFYERWAACESTSSGMSSAAIHALITSSIVAIALFSLCLILSILVYRKLSAILGAREAPQPPDPVDDTWKS